MKSASSLPAPPAAPDSPETPDALHGLPDAPAGSLRAGLFSPLSLAAYVTWLAVFASVIDRNAVAAGSLREGAGVAALLAVLMLFMLRAAHERKACDRHAAWNAIVQGILVVAAEGLLREGQTVILLIIVAGQLVFLMPMQRALLWLAGFNGAIALLWLERSGSLTQTAFWLVPMLGFQAFAALTGRFAASSERDRERLAQVNAELLSTQRLLEETARNGERLKLSRELHDVARHKLTALKLNLRRLRRDPRLAGSGEVEACAALADELLEDIRGVVSELRAHDGLDLACALQALARPWGTTRIRVEVDPDLRVDDLAQAQALLRCAQEAITNALRHGRASEVRLRCTRLADAVELRVDNDGIAPSVLVAGNGLTGMRERLEALGGSLLLSPTPPRGVGIIARVPGGST